MPTAPQAPRRAARLFCLPALALALAVLTGADTPDVIGDSTAYKSTTTYLTLPTYLPHSGAEDYLLSWGGTGSDNGRFRNPASIATAPDGSVYVSEYQGSRIQHFSADGEWLATLTGVETTFVSIGGIAVGPDGSLYISETANGQLLHCDTSGNLIDSHDFPVGTEPGDLAIGLDGSIYVVSPGENSILKFDADLNLLGTFGGEGAGPGKLRQPSGIAVGPDGSVWVCDRMNYRVQKFSSAGKPLARFGSQGDGEDQFTYIRDIAVLPDGSILVTDTSAPAAIRQFSDDGQFLRVITAVGDFGSADYAQLLSLEGIAADREGYFYVVNPYFNLVHKLGPRTYQVAGPSGIIRGVVETEQTDEPALAQVAVRLEATDINGNRFQATILPDARGRFLFKRVPLDSAWKLSLIWLDRSRFRTSPDTYFGTLVEGPDRDNDFRISLMP